MLIVFRCGLKVDECVASFDLLAWYTAATIVQVFSVYCLKKPFVPLVKCLQTNKNQIVTNLLLSLNRKLKPKMLINCLHSILLQKANLTTVFQFEFLRRKERLESLSLNVIVGPNQRYHRSGRYIIFFLLLLHSIEYFRNEFD